jgi:hypothetical protein
MKFLSAAIAKKKKQRRVPVSLQSGTRIGFVALDAPLVFERHAIRFCKTYATGKP